MVGERKKLDFTLANMTSKIWYKGLKEVKKKNRFKIPEQSSSFNCLGFDEFPTVVCDVENKRNKFKRIHGTIHGTLKYKT